MQIKLFTLPISSSERSEDELNKFLRSHRVLQLERHFCPDNGGYWAFLVEYLDGPPVAEAPPVSRKEKHDFSKELDENSFRRFESFVAIRRDLAKVKKVPAYLIFTNEELALLAQLPFLDEENSKKVNGVSPSRLKDYAQYFYFNDENEKSGESDAVDS